MRAHSHSLPSCSAAVQEANCPSLVASQTGMAAHGIPVRHLEEVLDGVEMDLVVSHYETFDELHPKWGEVPPIVAVEVQSPGDRQVRVTRKIAQYLDSGVPVVWLVDYEERFVTVHRLGRSPQVFESGQTLTADELPGFRCLVEDFFRLPNEHPAQQTQPPAA